MAVDARGEFTFVVAVHAKSLLEEFVDHDDCFGKSKHYHLDFEIYIIVIDDITQIVFFDDLIWLDINLHPHIPLLGQRCFEVEVFKVKCYESGSWRGND